jgi:hypothetical protein
VAIASFAFLPSQFASLKGVTDLSILTLGGDPRWIRIRRDLDRHRAGQRHPAADRVLHRDEPRPVKDVGQSSETGAATVNLSGVSIGMESGVHSALLIGGAVFGSYLLATGNATVALFAAAMAGIGLLTTVGVIVSMDSFGPALTPGDCTPRLARIHRAAHPRTRGRPAAACRSASSLWPPTQQTAEQAVIRTARSARTLSAICPWILPCIDPR